MADDSFGSGAPIVIAIVLVVLWFVGAAVFGDRSKDPKTTAKAVVEDSGYENVVITDDWAILACGRDDAYRMRWKGTSSNGKEVHGQVCAGLMFKGWTVRLER